MANLAGSMIFDTSTPKFPLPILHIHGTLDAAVPLSGSKNPIGPFLAIDDVLKKWVQ